MKGRRVLTVVGGALVALALLWALTLRPDPVDTDEPVPPPVMTPAAPRDGQEATEEGARAAALTFVEVVNLPTLRSGKQSGVTFVPSAAPTRVPLRP